MKLAIEKVLSGGQTGADQAGWRAAKALGIPTGGLMPAGFRTEGAPGRDAYDEDHPEFAALYGATAHHSRDYPPRTRINVESADLTLIFNPGEVWSRGTVAAVTAARKARKRFVVVGLAPCDDHFEVVDLQRDHDSPFTGLKVRPVPSERAAIIVLRVYLIGLAVRTLNVAGSRESNHPGIGAFVEAFLLRLLAPEPTPNESGDAAIPPQPARTE